MTTRRKDQQSRTPARRRSGARRAARHSRKRSAPVQWFSGLALAVLASAMLLNPHATGRPGLAAEVAASVPREVRKLAEPEAAPTPVPTSTPTFSRPLRPAPTLTRKPRGAKPNVTVSTGRLGVVPGSHPATGSRDKLTYRVEIEDGLSVNPAVVAATIHETLTDPRGWQAVHPVNFERTDSEDSDLRIILATPTLTDKLCLPLDTGGEVSCRVEDRVVLNAKRWVYAVPAYSGQVDKYRDYLVNHEVGHALGHGHSTCSKAKTPAPVMMQQTKGLGGCLPNAWPTVKAT